MTAVPAMAADMPIQAAPVASAANAGGDSGDAGSIGAPVIAVPVVSAPPLSTDADITAPVPAPEQTQTPTQAAPAQAQDDGSALQVVGGGGSGLAPNVTTVQTLTGDTLESQTGNIEVADASVAPATADQFSSGGDGGDGGGDGGDAGGLISPVAAQQVAGGDAGDDGVIAPVAAASTTASSSTGASTDYDTSFADDGTAAPRVIPAASISTASYVLEYKNNSGDHGTGSGHSCGY